MSILTTFGDLFRGKADLSFPRRSSQWPTVRKTHLSTHGTCAVCNGTTNLEVHHIKPFHVDPTLELAPSNLITLCEAGKDGINCHLLIGHLGNFKSVNLDVVADAAIWNTKISNRPTDARLVE